MELYYVTIIVLKSTKAFSKHIAAFYYTIHFMKGVISCVVDQWTDQHQQYIQRLHHLQREHNLQGIYGILWIGKVL